VIAARGGIAFAILLAFATTAVAEPFQPPKLEGHLVDTSATVTSSMRSSVDRRLESFRKSTGFAIVVFVTGSLAGQTIEDVAYATFNAWKIGEAGKDNGILLVIAPKERKLRIETGKGVGGAVTDLQANEILSKMGPAMSKYALAEAIGIACDELEKLLKKEAGPKPLAAPTDRGRATWLYVFFGFLGLAGVCGILAIFSKRFRTTIWPVVKAFGFIFWGILKLFEMFTGSKKSSSDNDYKGGGGTSGGGGSSTRY
jgi:uncharacterized protein